MAHTPWLGYSAPWRTAESTRGRRRLAQRCGLRSPSSRQRGWVGFLLIFQPSRRRISWAIFQLHLGCDLASRRSIGIRRPRQIGVRCFRWRHSEQPAEDKELEHPQEPEDGEGDRKQERCCLGMAEMVGDADMACHFGGGDRQEDSANRDRPERQNLPPPMRWPCLLPDPAAI